MRVTKKHGNRDNATPVRMKLNSEFLETHIVDLPRKKKKRKEKMLSILRIGTELGTY